jgi:NAD(P)-dependent dehydrogenase (short-subunit alcohol dehydrogenase family)
MPEDQSRPQNPLEQEPKPPFPEQQQPPPGLESEMQPRPDYGEQSYRGSGRLQGKAAIITGGDSGIGRAVALAFAREGADILISYLNEESDAQETARVVQEAGRKAVRVPGDISEEAHCQSLVQRAMQEFGHLDILVNNAAFSRTYQGIAEIPSEEFDYTFRTNLYAMFYFCKAALPHMPPDSTIINTSSIQAYQPDAPLLAYATTKGAIITFSKGLAKEAIKRGIRVNVVAPGPGVDAPYPRLHARAADRAAWQGFAYAAASAAGGVGAPLCIPGLAGIQLHRRRGDWRDRRGAVAIGKDPCKSELAMMRGGSYAYWISRFPRIISSKRAAQVCADDRESRLNQAHAAVRYPIELVDHAHRSNTVELVGHGRLRLGIALRHQHQESVAAHHVVDEPNGARLPHGEWDCHQREHGRVPKWQDRERIGNGEVPGATTRLDGHQRASARFGSVMRSRPRP